jgi:SH3-like domain-containing protein
MSRAAVTPLVLALALAAGPVAAADFRSVAENGTIMYDAPSLKAKKLYLAPLGLPVEVMVDLDAWVKVRDRSGDLTWVESRALSSRRTVVITTPVADVRQSPDDKAPISFRVQQGVALELSEMGSAGWAKVRHRDGSSGYVRIGAIWGY